MSGYLLFDQARWRLEEIVDYTQAQWGDQQADRYLGGMVARFEAIAARSIPWRALPAEFGIDGFFCRYERHYIYWKIMNADTIGIVTILHERMQQTDALRVAFRS